MAIRMAREAEADSPIIALIENIMREHEIKNLRELSQKTGIKYATLHALYRIKDRKPKPETIQKLCETFSIKDMDKYIDTVTNTEITRGHKVKNIGELSQKLCEAFSIEDMDKYTEISITLTLKRPK